MEDQLAELIAALFAIALFAGICALGIYVIFFAAMAFAAFYALKNYGLAILHNINFREWDWTEGDGAKQQKHCCHIFALKNGTGGPQPVVKNISLDTLTKVLREYRSNGVHLYTEYTAELERFRQGKSSETYFPVYFSYDTPGYDRILSIL